MNQVNNPKKETVFLIVDLKISQIIIKKKTK